MNQADKKIAFIGLGVMGYPMAKHWAMHFAEYQKNQSHTIQMCVFNRTQSKATEWISEVQRASLKINPNLELCTAKTVEQAVTNCDVVATCLGGDDDLREVYFDQGLVDSMKPGSLVIDHTTASANIAKEIHQSLNSKDVGFLDAPISGGQIGAQNGTLSIMAGGDEDDFKRGLSHMESYGKSIVHIGNSGSGQTAKMVNQICIAGLLQGLSEGLAFGKKAGLDMEKVISVISKGAAASWQMEQRSKTMLAGQFDFGFAVKWMLKDLNIALEEASRIGAECHFTAMVKELYEVIREQGGENLDTSALMKLVDG